MNQWRPKNWIEIPEENNRTSMFTRTAFEAGANSALKAAAIKLYKIILQHEVAYVSTDDALSVAIDDFCESISGMSLTDLVEEASKQIEEDK